MRALPIPPKKVTELVPLPVQPPQVKTPEVEKVTGSALASDVASVTIARSNALIRVALKRPAMLLPFVFAPDCTSAPALLEGRYRMAFEAPVSGLCFPSDGALVAGETRYVA